MFGPVGDFIGDMILPGLGGVMNGPAQVTVEDFKGDIQALDEEAATLTEERNKELEQFKTAEAAYREQLDKERASTISGIDDTTARLLEQAGIMGNIARSQTGADMANRGLLRSSFTGQALNKVNLAEQQQKADARLAGEEQKDLVQATSDDVIRNIAQRRKQIAQQKRQEQLRATQTLKQGFEKSKIGMQFAEALSTTEIREKDKQELAGSVGILLTSAMSAFTGGLF